MCKTSEVVLVSSKSTLGFTLVMIVTVQMQPGGKRATSVKSNVFSVRVLGRRYAPPPPKTWRYSSSKIVCSLCPKIEVG